MIWIPPTETPKWRAPMLNRWFWALTIWGGQPCNVWESLFSAQWLSGNMGQEPSNKSYLVSLASRLTFSKLSITSEVATMNTHFLRFNEKLLVLSQRVITGLSFTVWAKTKHLSYFGGWTSIFQLLWCSQEGPIQIVQCNTIFLLVKSC